MYKNLKAHKHRMETAMASVAYNDWDALLRYHLSRVRDFQHERLAHLLVTLFFGFLVIASVAALFTTVPLGNTIVTSIFSFTSVLLLVVELFYVGYYYLLENGVQKLYALTEKLYEEKP